MKIWIDGDSFPGLALEIVLQIASRASIPVEVVSDRPLNNTVTKYNDSNVSIAKFSLVPEGSGQTDDYIFNNSLPDDIVATRDLELADRLLVKVQRVLNDRGAIWTAKSLARRLEDSRIMHAMRVGGMKVNRGVHYGRDDALRFRKSLEVLISGYGVHKDQFHK